MSPVEAAWLAGFLTGSVLSIPLALILNFIIIPRAVDLWVFFARRRHGG